MGDLKLVDEKKKSSKNDIVFEGKTLELKIEPCPDGAHVMYGYHDKIDIPFGGLGAMIDPESLPEVFYAVDDEEVHVRWFDRFIGRSLETKISSAVARLKRRIKVIKSRSEDFKQIKERLE